MIMPYILLWSSIFITFFNFINGDWFFGIAGIILISVLNSYIDMENKK